MNPRFECLCGAPLRISEASSGARTLIEPHKCKGFDSSIKHPGISPPWPNGEASNWLLRRGTKRD